MVVTCERMRSLEAAALAGGRTEDSLMEEAGAGVFRVVREFFPTPGTAVVFAGKGHNAGDAFVVARHMLEAGWKMVVREVFPRREWRPLVIEKWQRIADRLEGSLPPEGPLLLLDGLLGLGGEGPLRGPILSACQELNHLRLSRHAQTVAIDLPSGLNADSGDFDPHAVVSDITATIGSAKTGLLAEGALDHVGRLSVVPVPALESPTNGGEIVLVPRLLRRLLPKRRHFSMHKGEAGRVGIVAGSPGYAGAARLCSAAAVAGGAGLITLFVPPSLYDICATGVLPEVMVRTYRSLDEIDGGLDVLAIGPGLGQEPTAALPVWLSSVTKPVVVDADALNALARAGLSGAPLDAGPRLLTPHPGEMKRLLASWRPELAGHSRRQQVLGLTAAFQATVVLKGARSLVGTAGHPLAWNTTGHPGMASGGMGDVLTGLCGALIAQGCGPHAAASLGCWLLGRAAERALTRDEASPESLRASDVISHLGAAFNCLRTSDV